MATPEAEPSMLAWLSPNRHVQIAVAVVAALVFVALSVLMLLRLPRVREAVRDVWPFRLWLRGEKKKPPPRRFFEPEESSDESDAEAPPPAALSGLSQIVLLAEPPRPARVEEVEEPKPAATFTKRKKAVSADSG